MTIQEQIEEIAKIIDNLSISIICEEGVECLWCNYYTEKDCMKKFLAEALYNAGYRKVNEDENVVSKKEYERQLMRYRNLEINYEAIYEAYMQARTDIAQDILQAVVLLATEKENEDFMSIDAENAIARLSYNIQQHFKAKYGVKVKV